MEAVLSFSLSLFPACISVYNSNHCCIFFSDLSGGQRPDKLYQRFKGKQKRSAKVDEQEDARFHSYN